MGEFLPICKEDMEQRGWDQCDFVYVIGDAYVDHPSFGHAIISRVLESHGYRVGIISQPDWKDPDSISILGKPRLGFLVMGGNMDSMVNHYSVSKHRRNYDYYTPGGKPGHRPDYAVTVYCNLIRRSYPKTPILIGGIEASLRRFAHYDYWSDKLKRSILLDSQADLLLYGMGEHSIVEAADALNSGLLVNELTFLRGTVYKTRSLQDIPEYVTLPSWDELRSNPKRYAESFAEVSKNMDAITGKVLVEPYSDREFIVQNPPSEPLTQQEMDDVYELPYMRTYHPSYEKLGGVDAIQEVRFSLTSCRGCFGGCSFCALTYHQGRVVQTRSHESLLREAELMIKDPEFKGYIHDVGGPTANFRRPACDKQLEHGVCNYRQCLFPTPCKNLIADHSDYLTLLRKLRALPGVKKVFIRSGIRFDYLLCDPDDSFFRELVQYHVSGQLKVAPEHISDHVLSLMGKPRNEVFRKFQEKYDALNRRYHKDQYLVAYLISSHPGSTLKDAIALAEYLHKEHASPEQVQDFYPTPSTVSTVMYYTGYDPRTMQKVYVARNPHEKAMQRALIQYRNPKNYELVHEALTLAGRQDLIGYGPDCLIRPKKDGSFAGTGTSNNRKPAAKRNNSDQSESRSRKNVSGQSGKKHR
ncbi:MAG: YgiQ family radical SAM protein [Oscillospiraceae bacterium]|nr:YgiQ family radical SAM protein [Oscillospiraceae bacterium]